MRINQLKQRSIGQLIVYFGLVVRLHPLKGGQSQQSQTRVQNNTSAREEKETSLGKRERRT